MENGAEFPNEIKNDLSNGLLSRQFGGGSRPRHLGLPFGGIIIDVVLFFFVVITVWVHIWLWFGCAMIIAADIVILYWNVRSIYVGIYRL